MLSYYGYGQHAYLEINIIVGRYSMIGTGEYENSVSNPKHFRFQCKNRKVYYTATSLMLTKKKKKF